MFITIVMLVVSLAAVLVGANLLVDGSSALARRFGMSDVTVGLTVVAFGTSSPELAISIVSALDGATSLTVGNVVGSNALNIMMIIGITAMIKPLKVERTIMSQQMPLMVLSALLLLMLGNSSLLDGTATNIITRTSGLFMLLLFVLFMVFTVLTSKVELPGVPAGQKLETGINPPVLSTPEAEKSMPLWKQILWIALGLAGLILGGSKFVDSASVLAASLGMSEATIGLTIVAMGTSLPELAASIVAAFKGNPGLAVGNVIGSNIFNATFVLGAGAACAPLSMGTIGNVDLLVLTAASLLFWLEGRVWGNHVINRWEGAILFLGYVAYTAWLLAAV
ncbi:MAG: calcium/sodium antiporter [Muribaculaceae bacterium]